MKCVTMTTTTLTENGNKMKEAFLEQMGLEGLLSEEQITEMNKYCFVVAEKTFFGSIWDKIFWKSDKDAIRIIVVKVLNKE